MAYIINLDDDIVGTEELQLLKTKHAILEKLRVRFAEFAHGDDWATGPDAEESPLQRADHPR
jgi:hypothetical protein